MEQFLIQIFAFLKFSEVLGPPLFKILHTLLFTVYDLRRQCRKIYSVMKKDFVLDRRDGRVAEASGFIGKSCAGDRVRFPCPSNLTQVAMARHCWDVKLCALWRFEAKMGPRKLAAPIKAMYASITKI